MTLEKLEQKVYKNIVDNKLIIENDRILVAVSSGSDSMTLINSLFNIMKLNEIKFDLGVVHINHGLRKESEEEENYVRNYCNEKNIPFYSLRADVLNESKRIKKGIEETARDIRYKFFDEILKEKMFNKIAIAHNKNDNVETILFNILRGSSTKGLIGMEFVNGVYIRPLINIFKEDIENYCKNINLKYYNDSSNFSKEYTRNKIRLDLIPYLRKEFNENIDETLLRLSKIAKEDEIFLNNYTNDIVNDIIINVNKSMLKFNHSELIKQTDCIINRVILNILNKLLGNVNGISYVHIMDINKLLKNNIRNKKYIIGNKFTLEILNKNISIVYLNRRD